MIEFIVNNGVGLVCVLILFLILNKCQDLYMAVGHLVEITGDIKEFEEEEINEQA